MNEAGIERQRFGEYEVLSRLGHGAFGDVFEARHTADGREVALKILREREPSAVREHGHFREDLYYRLRGVELQLPGLDERPEDIPTLAEHFAAEAARRNSMPSLRLTDTAMAALRHGQWPGGVRQLAAACESAAVEAWLEGATRIEVHHLFVDHRRSSDAPPPTTLDAALEEFERSFVAAALRERDWNVSQTARDLAVSRSTLNALIRRFGLNRVAAAR